MIDIIELAQNETVYLDTTNNTINVVLLTPATVEIYNENNVLYAKLEVQYEIFTLAINTGVFYAKCTSVDNAKLMIIREFIY